MSWGRVSTCMRRPTITHLPLIDIDCAYTAICSSYSCITGDAKISEPLHTTCSLAAWLSCTSRPYHHLELSVIFVSCARSLSTRVAGWISTLFLISHWPDVAFPRSCLETDPCSAVSWILIYSRKSRYAKLTMISNLGYAAVLLGRIGAVQLDQYVSARAQYRSDGIFNMFLSRSLYL